MGDLSDVFEFLISLVGKIVNATVNVIVTVLLVVACVPPWRLVQIYADYLRESRGGHVNWKEFCVVSFAVTIFNLISASMCCFGLLSPVRWCGVGLILSELLAFNLSADDNHEAELFAGCMMFFAAIADLFCYLMGVFTLLSPFGRQIVILKLPFITYNNGGDKEDAMYRAVSFNTSKLLFVYGLESIADIGVFILSFFALLVPSTWITFYTGVSKQLQNTPADSLPSTWYYQAFKDYKRAWSAWFDATRDHFFMQFLHAMIDFGVSPFLLLALISPFRQGKVLSLLKCSCTSAYAVPPAEEAAATEQPAAVEENGVPVEAIIPQSLSEYRYVPPPPSVGDFDYEYNYDLRTQIVYYGLLALSDLFLIPMILPLYLTQYRYVQIREELYPEDGSWGHKQLFLVASQFCLLCFDAIFLTLTLPVLFLTRFRWKPIQLVLQKEKVFLSHNAELYCTILEQIMFMAIDFFFIPIVLLLLCSHRGPAVWNMLRDPLTRNTYAFTTYMYLVINFLTYTHDLVFMLPMCCVIAIVALHRLPVVVYHVTDNKFETTHPFPTFDRSSPQYSHTEIHRYNEDRFDADWMIRFKIWGCFFQALVDIPFYFMALFVSLTLWRVLALYEDLCRIKPYYSQRIYTYYEVMEDAPSKIRSVIWQQFMQLLRDMLCVLPLSIVVVTLYRLPSLIISFMASAASAPLLDTAVLEVFDAKITFVEGGEPQMTLFLKGRHEQLHAITATHGKFYVLGMKLWEEVGTLFGNFVAGFAKSFLPLSFEADKNMQWKVKVLENYIPVELDANFSEFASAIQPAESQYVQNTPLLTSVRPQAQNLEAVELVLNLPLKGVKKSTMIKKLAKFPFVTKMVFQMECMLQMDARSAPQKKVLFRWIPTVENVMQALEAEDGSFQLQSFGSSVADGASYIGLPQRFVDEFHISVLKSFVEVLLDVLHLMLFVLTFISPYRWLMLIRAMFQSKESVSLYLMEKILTHLTHAENHLRSYRGSMANTLNDACKDRYQVSIARHEGFDSDYIRMTGRFFMYSSLYDVGKALKKVQSKYDFLRYKSLCKTIKSDLKLLQDGTESFVLNINDIFVLHDDLLEKWFAKSGLWVLMGEFEFQRQQKDLISFLLTEQHDHCAKDLIVKRQQAQETVESYRAQLKTQKTSKIPGFIKKSTDENRAIIRNFFGKALMDWTGLAMLCLLVVTGIRLFPFLRDLFEQRREVFSHPTLFRSVLVKHSRALATDSYHLLVFLACSFVVVVSVGGIPDYLVDLVNNMQSFRKAAECAKHHSSLFFRNLWYLFSLFFVFRTYRIVLKSALFCVLIPGALVGECFDFLSTEANVKFMFGSLVYFAVLVGCIVTVVQIKSDGLEYLNTNRSNDAILAISAVIVAILLFGAVVKIQQNLKQTRVAISDSKKFVVTWSHVSAMLIAPIECLQLSAIVMNFFWHPVTIAKNSPVVTDTRYEDLRIGGDNLSTIMFWGSEQSEHSSIYRTGLTIAAVFVIFWAVLIAIPVAQGGGDNQKQQKMKEIRNSAIFDVSFNFFTNMTSVWIIATLMRTWSCMQFNGESVLSTMEETTCGGGSGFWPASVAFPFLSYYMITSGLVYTDASTDPSTYEDNGEASPHVRFGNVYNILVKVAQLCICAACFGAFGTAPAIAVLLPIMFVCAISGLLPLILNMFTEERICNVPAIVPIRSAGYFCVLWTCIVCLVRSFAYSPESMQHTTIFASEGTIYVGWGIIFILATWKSWSIESYLYKTWNEKMLTEGLSDATASLLNLYNMALVETSAQSNFFSKSKTAMLQLQQRATKARSVHDIATMVLSLEEHIVIDKLNDEFLLQRHSWKNKLDKIYMAKAMNTYDIDGPWITTEHDRFNVVLGQMNILMLGFRSNLATTPLSRDVISILLSNHIPRDVCWYIFEFLINTKELQKHLTRVTMGIPPPKLLATSCERYPDSAIDHLRHHYYSKLQHIQETLKPSLGSTAKKGPDMV